MYGEPVSFRRPWIEYYGLSPGKFDTAVQCKDVGNCYTCPRYDYYIGTLVLKVSQILFTCPFGLGYRRVSVLFSSQDPLYLTNILMRLLVTHYAQIMDLYISCKNNIGNIIKPIFQTGISCISVVKLTSKYPLFYPTDMKPLEAYFIKLMTVIVATMPSGHELQRYGCISKLSGHAC